jgi:uncharacterized membrane protein HdeD (DUF308 family)
MNNIYDSNFDYVKEFTDRWNKKVRSIRISGIIIAVLMAVLGVVCLIFPEQSLRVIEIIASCVIIALGVCQMVDYFSLPVIFRRAGILLDSILNIILGVILLCSPADVSIATFAFMFGFLLMIFGIDLLAFSSKLGFFGVSGYGWVIANGILSVIASMAFFFMPLASSIALNIVLAIYLIVGGATLLIETLSMKDLRIKDAR